MVSFREHFIEIKKIEEKEEATAVARIFRTHLYDGDRLSFPPGEWTFFGPGSTQHSVCEGVKACTCSSSFLADCVRNNCLTHSAVRHWQLCNSQRDTDVNLY